MTEEWQTIDELLSELDRVKYVTVEYLGKPIRLAWKEVSDNVNLDVKFDKPYSEMNEMEQADANFKMMDSETFARISSAGEQPDCFQKNVMTPEQWAKLPKRLKALIITEMFSLMKSFDKRF